MEHNTTTKYREIAATATQIWTDRARNEAAHAKEARQEHNAQKARNHATEAAKAAWNAELAAIASHKDDAHNAVIAAREYAEVAKDAAERAEAEERWKEGQALLESLLHEATKE